MTFADVLWGIGQFGILLEILGAGIIVLSAFLSRRQMRGLGGTSDMIGDSVEALIKVVKRQFNGEFIGFLLLGLGLLMQFMGGFVQYT
jgi:hypothetical protein